MSPRRRHESKRRDRPELEELTNEDLLEVQIRAPGMVATSDDPEPWHASPLDSTEAGRVLRERGYWR